MILFTQFSLSTNKKVTNLFSQKLFTYLRMKKMYFKTTPFVKFIHTNKKKDKNN